MTLLVKINIILVITRSVKEDTYFNCYFFTLLPLVFFLSPRGNLFLFIFIIHNLLSNIMNISRIDILVIIIERYVFLFLMFWCFTENMNHSFSQWKLLPIY